VSTLTKHNRLLGEAAAAAKAAREIAEKAVNDGDREMTTDERAEFDQKFAEATDKKAQADVAKKDMEVMAQAKSLADLVGLPESAKGDLDAQLRDPSREQVRKSLGAEIVGSAQFKAAMAPFKDGRIPQGTHFSSDPIPVKSFIRSKSVFTGGSSTSAGAFVVNERTDILETLGRREYRLRDLISVRTTGSDSVEFVQQTSHTNNAAEVAEATSSALPTQDGSTGRWSTTLVVATSPRARGRTRS
jgi:HK97 family phage major capsid protein